MAAWIWLLLGLFLLVGEILTPGGFYVVFFGIGALVVGALGLTGIELSPTMQWLLFPMISIASLALFRRPLMNYFKVPSAAASDRVDSLIGQTAVALADLEPGGLGQVELRGSPWSAKNIGHAAIHRGARVVVERVAGLELDVRVEA